MREHTYTHTHTNHLTIVELAVALLTVDDIKTVWDIGCHVTNFKVKPLGMLRRVNIWIQYEVIFISRREERTLLLCTAFKMKYDLFSQ